MVDTTDYKEGKAPNQALKAVFGRLSIDSKICLLAAEAGLLTVESFAMLRDSVSSAKDTASAIVGSQVASSESEKAVQLLAFASIWQCCYQYQAALHSGRASVELDPQKIPEMSDDDHADMRARFVLLHVDMLLFDDNEPHKKLVERISRDFLIQALVRYNEAAELRTKNETIFAKTGLTQTAEELLSMAKQDQKCPPATVEVFFNRIFAFFVALEYLNICRFNSSTGTFRYFKEFGKERPGLASALLADQLIRKKVSRLMEEQRIKFPTYSEALIEVLDNHTSGTMLALRSP